MKRILVIGLVLLSLIALTGMASAATEGKAEIMGDVPPSLELVVSGGGFGVTFNQGDNNFQGVTVTVTNNGYEDGYQVLVADKLDSLNSPDPGRCLGTDVKTAPGKMLVQDGFCWGTPALSNPLHIIGSTDVTLSGSDQTLYSTTTTASGSYGPTLSQTITPADKPAIMGACADNGMPVQCVNYKIIITFTVISN